jgi:hypothetical protein
MTCGMDVDHRYTQRGENRVSMCFKNCKHDDDVELWGYVLKYSGSENLHYNKNSAKNISPNIMVINL